MWWRSVSCFLSFYSQVCSTNPQHYPQSFQTQTQTNLCVCDFPPQKTNFFPIQLRDVSQNVRAWWWPHHHVDHDWEQRWHADGKWLIFEWYALDCSDRTSGEHGNRTFPNICCWMVSFVHFRIFVVGWYLSLFTSSEYLWLDGILTLFLLRRSKRPTFSYSRRLSAQREMSV